MTLFAAGGMSVLVALLSAIFQALFPAILETPVSRRPSRPWTVAIFKALLAAVFKACFPAGHRGPPVGPFDGRPSWPSCCPVWRPASWPFLTSNRSTFFSLPISLRPRARAIPHRRLRVYQPHFRVALGLLARFACRCRGDGKRESFSTDVFRSRVVCSS